MKRVSVPQYIFANVMPFLLIAENFKYGVGMITNDVKFINFL
jgi:hypothetical protein